MSDFAGAGSDGFTHTRCRLAAASLKSPAAGSLSPPPNVELCVTHEDMPTPRLGDTHTAVSSGRLLSCTLLCPSLSPPVRGWRGEGSSVTT